MMDTMPRESFAIALRKFQTRMPPSAGLSSSRRRRAHPGRPLEKFTSVHFVLSFLHMSDYQGVVVCRGISSSE